MTEQSPKSVKRQVFNIICHLFRAVFLLFPAMSVAIISGIVTGTLMGAAVALFVSVLLFYLFGASKEFLFDADGVIIGIFVIGSLAYHCVTVYNAVYDKSEDDDSSHGI